MKTVTYFADLSPYSYAPNGRDDDLVEQPDAVNIGWLGAGHEFPAGQAPEWLVPVPPADGFRSDPRGNPHLLATG